MTSLPEDAFLPPNLKDSPERFGWMTRRNSLFAQATDAEKKVLLDLAEWHSRQRFELVRTPNVFTKATAICVQHWFYAEKLFMAPKANPVPKPGVAVYAFAQLGKFLHWGDKHLKAWQRKRFLERLAQQVSVQRDGDVMLGLAYFLCVLRVDIASFGTEGLSKRLSSLAKTSLENSATPAMRLLDRLVPLILLEESMERQHQLDTRFPKLKEHVWHLLLRAVKDDPTWVQVFIDEHWKRESKWSGMLSVWPLHGQSDLAYRLALTTRVDRPEFAADMLLEAIQDAGWKVTKDRNAAPESLVCLLDAACDHLWSWLQEPLSAGIANDDIQDRLGALFRYGNPGRPYWSELPACALKVIESISVDEQARVLSSGLLAMAIFYSDQDQQTATCGTALFRACLQHRSLTASSVRQLSEAAVDATKAISVMEGGILSGRNRYVTARPEHSLMQVVADYLDESKDKMRTLQPATVLVDQMDLALGVRVETLFCRLMEQFRNEFEQRVKSFPVDAGLALKRLIQYKGYSQTDDDLYRKQVCQDLFDALVPSLDAVSADDAAVARSGIGWSSFPADIW